MPRYSCFLVVKSRGACTLPPVCSPHYTGFSWGYCCEAIATASPHPRTWSPHLLLCKESSLSIPAKRLHQIQNVCFHFSESLINSPKGFGLNTLNTELITGEICFLSCHIPPQSLRMSDWFGQRETDEGKFSKHSPG